MENQHKKISGYRELTQVEIDLMNRIKAQGSILQALIRDVQDHLDSQIDLAAAEDASETGSEEFNRIVDANPDRWVEIATTDLQTGLMALTRAVAQPTTF